MTEGTGAFDRPTLHHVTMKTTRVRQPQLVEEWMAGSPLVEILFDDLAPDREGA